MIKVKTTEEIEIMRESALVVSRTLGILAKEVKPGVTTLFLDKIAEAMIIKIGNYSTNPVGALYKNQKTIKSGIIQTISVYG